MLLTKIAEVHSSGPSATSLIPSRISWFVRFKKPPFDGMTRRDALSLGLSWHDVQIA
jgi:hypothetical protein